MHEIDSTFLFGQTLNNNNELLISNPTLFEKNTYRIRPVLSEGTARAFDKERNSWVSGNEIWSRQAFVENVTKVRLEEVKVHTQVAFELQNIQTGTVYKTLGKPVVYIPKKKYVELLNNRLTYSQENAYAETKSADDAGVTNTDTLGVAIYVYILATVLFIAYAVHAGYKYIKMVKCNGENN